MTRRLVALVLVALALPAAPAGAVDPAAFTDRVRTLLDGFRERDGFPGAMAAFMLPDGELGAVATGWADRERRIPMTSDQRSLSGSVGKTFVAAVALSLAQEGRLDLDAKIATWLGNEPWFPRLPNGSDLTLRILLRHAGGLEQHVDLWRFWAKSAWRRVTRGADAHLSPLEQIGLVLGREPLFPAGRGFHYTDTGYLLVGLILEKAAARPYYELLRERFLDPLGLEHTAPSDRRAIPGLVAGYQKQIWFLPEKVTDDDGTLRFDPASEWTGGGLATNPRDLVRWAKALYEERALPEPYLDDLVGDPASTGKDLGYGLGVFVYQTPLGVAWGHGGWFPGYRTAMLYWTEHRIAVAVQLNQDGDGVHPREYALAIGEAAVQALGSPP